MNMDEKSSSNNNNNNDGEKVEDVMLPGFRFHPTDEELVGFYLKKKIQGRPLPIELIKQVDIYKFDPWDLPKFATTGEKEWYFYCPRDRKYRNSARPNRVTGAGFWKATGTDRPIYSSECSKCIGLKKSLVFYRGRAAKGIKTDWMMHEFRLPPIADSKKFLDKNIPPNDSWAICRIFKKTNTMAQRALSHSWAPHFHDSITPDALSRGPHCSTQLGLEDISCTTEIGPTCFQLFSDTSNYLPNNTTFFSTPTTVAKSSCFTLPNPNPTGGDISNGGFVFDKCTTDTPSTLMSSLPLCDVSKAPESIDFGGSHQFSGFSIGLPQEDLHIGIGIEEEVGSKKNPIGLHNGSQWAGSRSIEFPFNLPWDSPTCPSECFSTNKCYT